MKKAFMDKTTLRLSILCAVMIGALATASHAADKLGSIDFENSGSAEAQEPFIQGLAALHSFWYQEAIDLFREAQRRDPDFAMAYWGEAMAHTRPLWGFQDLAAGQAVLRRLGPTAEARAAKAPTRRERDYLQLVEHLYRDGGDQTQRFLVFSQATEWLAGRYPEDVDAVAFHTLTQQLISRPGIWQRKQRIQSVARLEELFDAYPDHPGVLHYMIHGYDEPILAPLGLRAALRYAEVAPAAPHALHMPSHIFVQLGMWDRAVASNEDAWQASVEWAERKQLSPMHRDFHSLSWLAYAYLQQGRYGDARRTLQILGDTLADKTLEPVHGSSHGCAPTPGSGHGSGSGDHQMGPEQNYHEMLARYFLESRLWRSAPSGQRLFDLDVAGTNATLVLAVGIGAVEMNDLERARRVAELLGRLRQQQESQGNRELAARAAVMEREVQGLLALKQGRRDEAVKLLAEASEIEFSLPPPSGPPHPAKPAQELFGEVLLALGSPADAVRQFEGALVRTPGRALSLLGAARGARALGDQATASLYYGQLLEAWANADANVDGLQEAKDYVAGR